ncbi:MAG: AAA family ATPase [Anaerolineae bacterium]|nr:AAA family ATPase [Anaerolineae bacterium]
MKQLTRIRLIHWHLFENETISCQGTTYFIGVNGVGKSTILDAIQFALVGGQRDVRFNRAAMDASKRTLSSYIRGELGIEGQRYIRKDTTGVVALEFRNPDGGYFVHGAVIDAYQDNRSPDISYFIINGSRLNDAWFFKSKGELFDSRAFRRHMEHFALPGGRAQLFTRLEDYRVHLLNRLGQLQETFTQKIVKGLAFSPLTDIRQFVHDYLLSENLVDVKTLQDQLETMRHFETLAADVRQRIEDLNIIEELDQERANQRRLRIINGYLRRHAQSDTHLAELKRRRLELDETQLDLSRHTLHRDDANENLKRARQVLLDAEIALRTDTTAQRAQQLQVEIQQTQVRIQDIRQRAATLRQNLTLEHQDIEQLCHLLETDNRPIPEALHTFTDQQGNLDSHIVRETQSALETLGHHYAEQLALVAEEARQLREEAEQLQREIYQLRTGDQDVSYEAAAPQAVQLRRLLRAELGLGADEVVHLCTVLNIPDEAWQDAVEGILGQSRFDLLVPPEHYDAAMQIYQRRRIKDKLYGVGLPDTERLLQYAQTPHSNTLAEEVKTQHPAAEALVNLLMGGYVKCDTLEGLRNHRTAVTRDCFVRRNYTSRHLNPRHYRRWFIGDRAIPRQIEQREERLGTIAEELGRLQDLDSALRQRLALTRDKVRVYVELEHALPMLRQLPELETEIAKLQAEHDTLDMQSVETLKSEVALHQMRVRELEQQVESLGEAIGSLRGHIETLQQQTLPELERQAAQALQEAEAFLIEEEELDLQDSAQKEYERRCQRQPLETVLNNASSYERDYANAEQRSRDDLQKNKQAYSFTYQFGYDNEDNADRYLKERDRYVESELPEYETHIAEQRAQAEQELVENFIHRLREQIEDARQQLSYLNATLSGLRFGGERFEFITKPEPTLHQVYNMIMDSQSILGTSLFESNFRQRHQEGWDLLFERLTAAPGDEMIPELQELQDYRNYLRYDIRIHYPDGNTALLSKIKAKKSGGETTTPFYVAMAASFAQAYRLNQPQPSDTVRLALFDEAFGKMDTARTASALQFMVDTKLQVILATPPDKAAGLLPYVDSVRTVVRKNNHAFVIDIDKEEMIKKLEAEKQVQ